jgi:hypothetical protein
MSQENPIASKAKVANGVDYFNPPRLVEAKWISSMNMRMRQGLMSQVPLKVYQENPHMLPVPFGADLTPITLMASLPTRTGVGNIVALSENYGYQLADFGTYLLGLTASSPEDGSAPALFTSDAIYRRWAGVVSNGFLLFTNPANPIGYTSGGWVQKFAPLANPNTGLVAPIPAGYYLETFYDHLVVGRPVISNACQEGQVAWSGLDDYSDWVNLTVPTAESKSESDTYDFEEDNSIDGPVHGVTGVKKFPGFGWKQDTLCVYLPREIWVGEYTGIGSGIIRFNRIVQGCGNQYQYSLCSVRDAQGQHLHYFIGEDNFYAFDGFRSATPFGDDIKDYFFNDISTNPDLRYRTYSYVDRTRQEIWFVYVSNQSSGAFDSAIVFNYREKIWWPASVEDVHSFHPGLQTYKSIFGYAGKTIASLAGTQINQLGNYGTNISRIYGTGNTQLLREETPSDPTVNCILPTRPLQWTSPDMFYGDVQAKKDIESLQVHATWFNQTMVGLMVGIDERNYFDEPVTFGKSELWTPKGQPTHGRMNYRGAARIFRFQFIPKPYSAPPPPNLLPFSSLLVQVPCQGGPYFGYKPTEPGHAPPVLCATPSGQPLQQRVLGGPIGTVYQLTVHIRGVVELKYMTSGRVLQPFVNLDGVPAQDTYNMYYLYVQTGSFSNLYFLNARLINQDYFYCYALDYQLTIPVQSGSLLQLGALVPNGYSMENLDINGFPITVGGVPPIGITQPFDGQFVQVDFMSSTYAGEPNVVQGPRGVVFSAWGENCNAVSRAEK